MPRLLYAIPCQRAVVDKYDNTVSLFLTFNNVVLNVPETTESNMPEELVYPSPWTFATCWERQLEEEDKEFEQHFTLVMPSGQEMDAIVQPLDFSTRTSNAFVTSGLIQVGKPGFLQLRVKIREIGTEDWSAPFDYPIQVVHNKVQVTSESTES